MTIMMVFKRMKATMGTMMQSRHILSLSKQNRHILLSPPDVMAVRIRKREGGRKEGREEGRA